MVYIFKRFVQKGIVESNGILGRGALAAISACKLLITSSKSHPEYQNFTLQKHFLKLHAFGHHQLLAGAFKLCKQILSAKRKLLPAVLFTSHGHKATTDISRRAQVDITLLHRIKNPVFYAAK